MNAYLIRQLKDLVSYLILKASYQRQNLFSVILRKVLGIHPMVRVVLLVQAGLIRQAKSITDKKCYSNGFMHRISQYINDIDIALANWPLFVRQINIPSRKSAPKLFNGQVLMVVNSCGLFDPNGYAVRSAQIKTSLAEVSVQTNFCARLGYPWDLPGRRDWPANHQVVSDEGGVWLQHDVDALVGRRDSEYWWSFAEHIRRVVHQLPIKPTILHAHSKYSNGIAAAIAGCQLGIPVVYEMRGLWHLTRAQNEPEFSGTDLYNYEERLEVWAAELADTVVVISASLKEWLIKHGISEAKVIVIPNAPNSLLETLPKISSKHTSILKLAFMGSLVSYEGIETVIEAVSLLVAKGIKISFDIFGDGHHRLVLERKVKSLGLRDHIRFHGQVNRTIVLKQISNFDIFPIVRVDSEVTRIIPPLKLLEPMAVGKVVLVSRLPALLESVPDCVGVNAISPQDSQALAEKLQFLWNNPEECARIGEKSRQWVARNRSWAENGRLYKRLYENIGARNEN